MQAEDFKRLAHQFMINAVKTGAGDNIWIEYKGPVARSIADACADAVSNVGGTPHLVDSGASHMTDKIAPMSAQQIESYGAEMLGKMQGMQGYIRIKDDAEDGRAVISPETRRLYNSAMRDMTDYRVNNTRWLVTAAPTQEFAAACGMTLPEFEDFYLKVCLTDYNSMSSAVVPLQELMTNGKKVRIYSEAQETELSFSIDGIPAVPCTGVRNIPDGECYTAPVRDSINGTIKYGPSSYNGERFAFIKLTFENGRVIEAVAENDERTTALNQLLDTDEGARYAGEWAINFNPYILHPTGNILFDEKIAGGTHIALGNCYDTTPNGNKSAIHWDMVHIQRPDYGGGEIWIDNVLIRKDGRFTLPELDGLNPENLMAASDKKSAAPAP